MITEGFVPTPASTYDYLVGAGVIPPHGRGTADGMRHWLRRILRVVGPDQEITTADSRIRLDPTVLSVGSRQSRSSRRVGQPDARQRPVGNRRPVDVAG